MKMAGTNAATTDRVPTPRVAILGAGPIGIACALTLARRGIASALIDARSVDAALQDRRLLALSRGTLMVLDGLLGAGFAPLAPIRDVRVSSAGEFGAARLSSSDFGGVDLGATCWYSDLVAALARAADREPLIEVRRPCRVTRLEQSAGSVRILLESAPALEVPLAVSAEGTPAPAAAPSHTALLADIRIGGLARSTAVERFTRSGPLAILPVPDAGTSATDGAAGHSMIWCVPRERALALAALGEAALAAEIRSMLGPRFGAVLKLGPRHQFALVEQRRARLREHRIVYIGNAAQSLHPVAGQGFNLGMRDSGCLAECLAAAPDPADALDRYCSARRVDRIAIGSMTSWLPRTFSRSGAPVAALRSAGLLAVDLLPPLRRAVSRLMMFGIR
jgi:2-octaprenyl-6-methoxyphenol hydroxylase